MLYLSSYFIQLIFNFIQVILFVCIQVNTSVQISTSFPVSGQSDKAIIIQPVIPQFLLLTKLWFLGHIASYLFLFVCLETRCHCRLRFWTFRLIALHHQVRFSCLDLLFRELVQLPHDALSLALPTPLSFLPSLPLCLSLFINSLSGNSLTNVFSILN